MLDKAKLLQNLKCARRGAAEGLTADHLLDSQQSVVGEGCHSVQALRVQAPSPKKKSLQLATPWRESQWGVDFGQFGLGQMCLFSTLAKILPSPSRPSWLAKTI